MCLTRWTPLKIRFWIFLCRELLLAVSTTCNILSSMKAPCENRKGMLNTAIYRFSTSVKRTQTSYCCVTCLSAWCEMPKISFFIAIMNECSTHWDHIYRNYFFLNVIYSGNKIISFCYSLSFIQIVLISILSHNMK